MEFGGGFGGGFGGFNGNSCFGGFNGFGGNNSSGSGGFGGFNFGSKSETPGFSDIVNRISGHEPKNTFLDTLRGGYGGGISGLGSLSGLGGLGGLSGLSGFGGNNSSGSGGFGGLNFVSKSETPSFSETVKKITTPEPIKIHQNFALPQRLGSATIEQKYPTLPFFQKETSSNFKLPSNQSDTFGRLNLGSDQNVRASLNNTFWSPTIPNPSPVQKQNPPASVNLPKHTSNASIFNSNAPIFRQSDPAFGHMKMGSTNKQISAKGCAVIALVNLSHSYGLNWKEKSSPPTPQEVINHLNSNKGFTEGADVYWDKIAGPLKLKFVGSEYGAEGAKKILKQDGMFCLIMTKGSSQGSTHFLQAYGFDQDGIYVRDSAGKNQQNYVLNKDVREVRVFKSK